MMEDIENKNSSDDDDASILNTWYSCPEYLVGKNYSEAESENTTHSPSAILSEKSLETGDRSSVLAGDQPAVEPTREELDDNPSRLLHEISIEMNPDSPQDPVGNAEDAKIDQVIRSRFLMWHLPNDCYTYALLATLDDPECDTSVTEGTCQNGPLQWKGKPPKWSALLLCTSVIFLQLVLMTLISHDNGFYFQNYLPVEGQVEVTRDIKSRYGYIDRFNSSDSLYRKNVFDFLPAANNVALFTLMHFTSFAVAFLYTAGDIYSGIQKSAFCIHMWVLSDGNRFWLFSRDASEKQVASIIDESGSESTTESRTSRNWSFLFVALIIVPFQSLIALYLTKWTVDSLLHSDSFSSVVIDLLVILYIGELDEKVMEFPWFFPRGSAERMDISGTKIHIKYEKEVHQTVIWIWLKYWLGGGLYSLFVIVAYVLEFGVGGAYLPIYLAQNTTEIETNGTDIFEKVAENFEKSFAILSENTWALIWIAVFAVFSVPPYLLMQSRQPFRRDDSRWQILLPHVLLFTVTSNIVFWVVQASGVQDASYVVLQLLIYAFTYISFPFGVLGARNFQECNRAILWTGLILCLVFLENSLFFELFARWHEAFTNETAPRATIEAPFNFP